MLTLLTLFRAALGNVCVWDLFYFFVFYWLMFMGMFLLSLLVPGEAFLLARAVVISAFLAGSVTLLLFLAEFAAGLVKAARVRGDEAALEGGRRVTVRMVRTVAEVLGRREDWFLQYRDGPVRVSAGPADDDPDSGSTGWANVLVYLPAVSPGAPWVMVFSGSGRRALEYRPGIWERRLLELYRRAYALCCEREGREPGGSRGWAPARPGCTGGI